MKFGTCRVRIINNLFRSAKYIEVELHVWVDGIQGCSCSLFSLFGKVIHM
jgi:hypothetical protein